MTALNQQLNLPPPSSATAGDARADLGVRLCVTELIQFNDGTPDGVVLHRETIDHRAI